MSNFVTTFIDGQSGINLGLTTGIPSLDLAINGVQKKTSIGIAAAPKCGKTTMADYCFLISPYLQMLREDRLDDIEWIYFSYEIDRVSKEFKIAALFMFLDYQLFDFIYKGKTYLICQDYLMGRLRHENPDGTQEFIPLTKDHNEKLKAIYLNRIVPLFGEYDNRGRLIRAGKVIFIQDADNPTGMWKYLMQYAKKHGEFLEEEYDVTDDKGNHEKKKRIIGYVEKNPKKYTIVITDHMRKLKRERGFTMKENIDKWLEYNTWLRNICYFTLVNVAHSNRGVANVDRLRFAGEFIFPTADDVKDTGNLAEESTILLTMFNPHDEKYNLTKHFGIELQNFPNYRSIHLTDSRYTECPVHMQVNMFGNINYFSPLIKQ